NVASILANPEHYAVRADLVNTQLSPKIVSDAKTGSHLLAMESWDFRLTSAAHYNNVAVNQMFTNAYTTFKAYAQMMQKQHPGQPVVVHTSYWGVDYQNNPRLTTAIQMIAAQLAGIDKLVFHVNTSTSGNSQILFDAQSFVEAQNGNSVANILQNMLQQTAQMDWQAGMNAIAGVPSVGSNIAAMDQ
ncbi:MAG TPA: hypothetical protein VN457_07350, partial [Chlamydiales bacterium]|nr:hypothetical protein [Chlamydiales bacterium]